MDDRGTRIGNETASIVPESARIRPLRDQIILEPLEWRPSDIIAVAQQGRAVRGIVKAIGPGRYPLKYDGRKGKRTKSWLGKHFIPTEVKVGDIVELGGIELGTGVLRGYAFQTFLWGTKEHLICSERDVTGIVSDD
jgi:hypothetical protein